MAWGEPDKASLERVARKIKRTDELGPGKYDEITGQKWTQKKIKATVFSKGAVRRYYDNGLAKYKKNIPSSGHYFKNKEQDRGMAEIRKLSKSPVSLRTLRH